MFKLFRQGRPRPIKMLVVGDACCGKSSLIHAFCNNSFGIRLAKVLPQRCFRSYFYEQETDLIIVDTTGDWTANEEQLSQFNVVILCYSCANKSALTNLTSTWLSRFAQLMISVPIILVGCKVDLSTDDVEEVETQITSILKMYPEIDTSIECSALSGENVSDVFRHAQKAVMYPLNIIFDRYNCSFTTRCREALEEVFVLSDSNRDGSLNEAELGKFQNKCFGRPLKKYQYFLTSAYIAHRCPEGSTLNGINFQGFLCLLSSYVENGRTDVPWICIRKFHLEKRLSQNK